MSIIFTDYSSFSKFLHIDNATGALYYQNKRITDESIFTCFLDRHNMQYSVVLAYQTPYNKPAPKLLAIRFRGLISGFQANDSNFRPRVDLFIQTYDDNAKVLQSPRIFQYYASVLGVSSSRTRDIIPVDIVLLFDYPFPSVRAFDVTLFTVANDARYFIVGQSYHLFTILEC